MKLLLTSGGLTNETLCKALEDLVGKPRQEIHMAFIPTAAFPLEDGHFKKDWLVMDMYRANEFCGVLDVVSLADLSRDELMKKLEPADVIFVGGGNTFYLSYMMEKSGMFEALPELLRSKVYVGSSAGSMVVSHSLRTSHQAIENPQKFYDEEYDELGPKDKSSAKTAGLVDFVIRPHMNSQKFVKIKHDWLKDIVDDVPVPLYALDDECAVLVDGDKIEVVGEGDWKVYD
jgi:dipeptidase E